MTMGEHASFCNDCIKFTAAAGGNIKWSPCAGSCRGEHQVVSQCRLLRIYLIAVTWTKQKAPQGPILDPRVPTHLHARCAGKRNCTTLDTVQTKQQSCQKAEARNHVKVTHWRHDYMSTTTRASWRLNQTFAKPIMLFHSASTNSGLQNGSD